MTQQRPKRSLDHAEILHRAFLAVVTHTTVSMDHKSLLSSVPARGKVCLGAALGGFVIESFILGPRHRRYLHERRAISSGLKQARTILAQCQNEITCIGV